VVAAQIGSPLTQLSEEEMLFRETVRRFATERVSPLVRRMDEEQQMMPRWCAASSSWG
jgi:alkylation response protein AidB-like acyl-CoA dehydrogenase